MKNCRYLFVSVLVWSTGLAFHPVLAQDSIRITPVYSPRLVLKWAPLSFFLDPDATLQAALEYRTSPRWAVQGELGYGWRGLGVVPNDPSYDDKQTWRVRAEIRHYTGRFRTNKRKGIALKSDFPLGNYLAFEALYKQVDVREQWTEVNAVSRTSSLRKTTLGGRFKVGRQIALTDRAHQGQTRLLVDIFTGIGFRWATLRNEKLTDPKYQGRCGCGFYDRFEADGLLPDVVLGLKLGFGL